MGYVDDKMGMCGVLLLLFTLLNLFTINDTCLYNCCNCGEVSPVNVYTTMGSTLELTCRIQEDNSSYHLMFVFDNNEHNEVDQSNFIIRDKYEHDPVDQSHFSTRRKNPIILNKTIKSFDDEGNYICYKDDKKVGSAFVEIEYPIQAVNDSDFLCELYDWDQSLSCSWKIGTYRKESNIEVKVIAGTMNHPKLIPWRSNITFCEWNGSFGEPYQFSFHLTVNNTKINRAVEFSFIRDSKSIVKPAPISHFYGDDITNTCLTVKWNNSEAGKYQIFKITMTNEWNRDKVVKEVRQTGRPRQQDFEFCMLIPYTDYTFTIVRKALRLTMTGEKSLGYVEAGYWSDPVSVIVKTLSDVPGSPPNITQGSFDRSYKNKTILYWKPIKHMDKHGIIENYRISFASQDGSSKGELFSQYENVTLHLHEDMWYNVSLAAVTSEGLWSPSISVLIPPKTDVMIPFNVVMELSENRSTANVKWKGREACQHYVVFWLADNTLTWHVSLKNTTVLDLLIPNIEKVGVSCSAELSLSASENPVRVGGGFFWINCKYFAEKAPALPDVTVTPHGEALNLAWTVDCDEDSSYPQWFNVTWCELDHQHKVCRDSFYELLEPGERKYRIEELNSNLKYRVRINSVSRDGEVRINPDFKDESLVRSNYDNGTNRYAEVIWPLAALTIIGLVIFMVVKFVWKLRSIDPEVELPDVHSKRILKDRGYTDDSQNYSEMTESKDHKVLHVSDACYEHVKHVQHNICNGEVQTGDNSNFSEVPNILEDIKKLELGKKLKATSQSSDYSKLINASGQTNNSEVFNQLVSQSESHFNQSKSPSEFTSSDINQSKPASVLSSSDINQSRPQTELSDNSRSTDHNNLKWHSSEQDESSSSSHVEDEYHDIKHDTDSSADTSAYLHSSCLSQNADSYSKMINDDSSAETEDEFLMTSQNAEQNNGCSQSSECCNSRTVQTSIESLPPETEQAPIDDGVLSPPDVCNPHDIIPQGSGTDLNNQQGEVMENLQCSNSSACMTSSASDIDEGGYKSVDLNSGCTSSIQSSVYSQI